MSYLRAGVGRFVTFPLIYTCSMHMSDSHEAGDERSLADALLSEEDEFEPEWERGSVLIVHNCEEKERTRFLSAAWANSLAAGADTAGAAGVCATAAAGVVVVEVEAAAAAACWVSALLRPSSCVVVGASAVAEPAAPASPWAGSSPSLLVIDVRGGASSTATGSPAEASTAVAGSSLDMAVVVRPSIA